jgi:hypothetical protein
VFRIGDVVRFESVVAGKRKFHLCISVRNQFIFLNSPKPKSFVGDFAIDCAHISGLNRLSRVSILVTGLEFGALILSLFFTCWAALAASKAARIAEEATKDADQALGYAAEGNRIARETSERELRAYVVPKDQEVFDLATGRKPIFRVKLYNSGQTPAHDVRCIAMVWASACDPDREKILFRLKMGDIVVSRDVIGGTDFKVLENGSKRSFDALEMQMVAQNSLRLIFAGVLSYRDIFGKRHLSTFRTYLEHNGDRARTRFELLSSAKGNKGN